MKKKSSLILLGSIFLMVLIFLLGCSADNTKTSTSPSDLLEVHFLDVGQGDSILIQTPGRKENILIDGGPREAGPAVVKYLKEHGVEKINLLIATHPHEDHIGGLVEVLKDFPVERIIDSGKKHTSSTYRNYIKLIAQKQIPISQGLGERIVFSPNIELHILGPKKQNYEDLNNFSVVSRLVYGKVAFLFTGDMEKEGERDLAGEDLKADVLKVGHHGSRSSTSAHFLRQVQPKIAIISLGAHNDYGHPHDITLKKLAKEKIDVYRTDLNGNVTVTTDGSQLNVEKDK